MDTETKANRDQPVQVNGPHATADVPALAYDRSKAELLADLKVAMADAEALIKEAAGSSVESFAALRARLEIKLGEMRAQGDRMRAAVGEKTKCAAGATHAYVKDNPWKSVGLFAVAGTILGVLLRRR